MRTRHGNSLNHQGEKLKYNEVTAKGAKYLVLLFFVTVICALIAVASPTYILPNILLPKYLEEIPNQSVAILTAYKEGINLYIIGTTIYFVCVGLALIVYIIKTFRKNLVGLYANLVILGLVIGCSGILVYVFNDMEPKDLYEKVSHDLEQFETGNFEYVEEIIYVDKIKRFDVRLTKRFEQNDSTYFFTPMQTWDVDYSELDAYGRPKSSYSYYKLPKDLDFKLESVKRIDSLGIDKGYEEGSIYGIEYTTYFKIVAGVTLVRP